MTEAAKTSTPRKLKYRCDICDLNIQAKNLDNIKCNILKCALAKIPTEKEELKKRLEEIKAENERLQKEIRAKNMQKVEKNEND